MKTFTALDFLNADISVTDLIRVYRTKTTEWSRPNKIKRDCEGLLFFVTGGIEYDFGDFNFKALPGQIVRLPSAIPYNGRKLSNDPNYFYCIDFSTAKSQEFKNLPLPYSFTPSNQERILNYFVSVEKTWSARSLFYKLECKNIFDTLIGELIKNFALNSCHYDGRSRIMRYSEYLSENAGDSDFHLSRLSEKFNVSETHMRRIFKNELGVSPSEYLSAIRMENAKKLLTTRYDLSVGEIANCCGYSSVYYFSSAFRETAGCSPTQFRKLGIQT